MGDSETAFREAAAVTRSQPRANHYGVIYADPPWTFVTHSAKGKGRSAEAHYDCMSINDIAALPVANHATKDCVLFLWTTDPMLKVAISVAEAWGFEYKTIGFVWAKSANHPAAKLGVDVQTPALWPIGTGFWTRANPEICLLATRGKPQRQSRAVRKLIVSPRREHSRKPDETYERIEALVAGPYLELFARNKRPGWDSWGLDVDSGIGSRRWASNSYPVVALGG